jgi:hypothetical protein
LIVSPQFPVNLRPNNALTDRIVEHDLPDRNVPVTPEHVEAAKEAILVQRRTHIDSLAAKLREPRSDDCGRERLTSKAGKRLHLIGG